MQIHDKIVDAVLTCNKWHLYIGKGVTVDFYSILNRDGKRLLFSTYGGIESCFLSIEDIYQALTHAKYVYCGDTYCTNPYVGLSDYEILVKCNLDNYGHETC